MTATVTAAFLRKEAQVLRRDPTFLFFLVLFPLLLESLLTRPFGKLVSGGDGAAQTVPGFTLMFGFYVVIFVGISHYRERSWGAWTVARVSGLSDRVLAVQVALPYALLSAAQIFVMLLAGHFLFGAEFKGSLVGLVLLIAATSTLAVAISLNLINLTSNLTAMQNLSQLVILGFGAIGGVLLPINVMPGWSQAAARFTPQYWALQGLKTVMAHNGGLADVLPNLAVLVVGAIVLMLLAVLRFDPATSRREAMR